MTQGPEDGARRSRKEQSPSKVLALDLLLISVCIALIATAQPDVFSKSIVAHADDEGGSTIPIPPPDRPTPEHPTQTPPETAVPITNQVRLDLTNLSLSPTTSVQTMEGALIRVSGSGIRIEADSSGAQRAIFPFALTTGQAVTSFHDTDSGLVWLAASSRAEGGALEIPLTTGRVPGGLTMKLGALQGNGQEAWAPILRAALRVGPVELESGRQQSNAAQLWADFHRLPPEIVLDVQEVALSSGLLSSLDEAVRASNMGIASIAFAVEVEADLSDEVSMAVMEMRVDNEWARGWGPDRMSIVRISTEDGARVLETTTEGEDQLARAGYTAQSPGGFSTFVLVALGELTSEESGSALSRAQWLGVGLGAIAMAGLAAGAFLLLANGRRA